MLAINFHKVSNVNWFENCIIYLKSNYNIHSVNNICDFFKDNLKHKKSLFITFDDGDKTFYYNVLPVIRKYSVPVTLFISPETIVSEKNFWFQEIRGYNRFKFNKLIEREFKLKNGVLNEFSIASILKCLDINRINFFIHYYQHEEKIKNKEYQNITIDQLNEINQCDFITLGAHTQNHPILSNESDFVSKFEIINSVDQLTKLTGLKTIYFAYPNGIPDVDFTEREFAYLEECGVKYAFSTKHSKFSIVDNIYSIPRFGLSEGGKVPVKYKLRFGNYWSKMKSYVIKSEAEKRKSIKMFLEIN